MELEKDMNHEALRLKQRNYVASSSRQIEYDNLFASRMRIKRFADRVRCADSEARGLKAICLSVSVRLAKFGCSLLNENELSLCFFVSPWTKRTCQKRCCERLRSLSGSEALAAL